MTTRGIHTKPVRGATNDWLTPPEIVKALGTFALDPCAHPQQFYRTARTMISPPEDGLSAKWAGRVWLNPPYGESIVPWMKRMADHGNGTALVGSRTEVEKWFWPFVWESATAVLFLRGRLCFYKPSGLKADGNAGHGSVLAAYGDTDAARLRASGIVGRYFRLKESSRAD